jgi:hypothetical protein
LYYRKCQFIFIFLLKKTTIYFYFSIIENVYLFLFLIYRKCLFIFKPIISKTYHNNTLQVVIENHWAPHLLRPALYVILCHGVFILYLNILLLAQIIHNGMWAIAIILRPLSINISHLNFLFCLYPRLHEIP